MAHSMTGYGLGTGSSEGIVLAVELRAVNHRYLELRVHLPPPLLAHEARVTSQLQQALRRGRIDAFVRVDSSSRALTRVRADLDLAKQYLGALRQICDTLHLPGAIDVMPLAGLRDVLVGDEPASDDDTTWGALQQALAGALTELNSARQAEGARLVEDLQSRLDTLRSLSERVTAQLPEIVQNVRTRLDTRVRELLVAAGHGATLDETRLLTEVALLAERSDATEELVRLRAHLDAMAALLAGDGQVGRKADFLCQELLREINTLGSKVSDLGVTTLVVELKTELERVREQIQNLE
ncbi:MAG: YicC/YloC family endoribonuclease [Pseudomonadota bacterium]